jgi:hypothetical protein
VWSINASVSCEGTVERRKLATTHSCLPPYRHSVINSVISPVASGELDDTNRRIAPLPDIRVSVTRDFGAESRTPARDGGPAGARVVVGGRERRRGRALRMGLTHAQAVRGTRALRAHQPEPRGRISPRFPSTVSAPTTNETRGCHAHLSSPLPPPRTPQGLRASAPDSPVRRFRAPRA